MHKNGNCLVKSPCHIAAFDLLVDTEVVVVAFGGDEALVHGIFHGAVGFVAVGAVGKMAVVEHASHLGKEMG